MVENRSICRGPWGARQISWGSWQDGMDHTKNPYRKTPYTYPAHPRGQGGARQAQVHPRRLCQMERVNTGWEGLRCWVAVWHRAASTFLSHLRQFHSNPPALVSSTSAAFLSIQVFGWLSQKNFSSLEQLRGTGLTPTVLEGRTFNPYLPGAFSYSSKSVYLKPQSSKSD